MNRPTPEQVLLAARNTTQVPKNYAPAVQQAIENEANRKRSEAMQSVAYAPKGEPRKQEKVVAQVVQPPSVKVAVTREAKAAASKTNQGTVETLLSRLEKVRDLHGGRFMACCPAHIDRTPSLSIRTTDDGTTLFHCFAGCHPDDVLAAVSLRWADLYPAGIVPLGPLGPLVWLLAGI